MPQTVTALEKFWRPALEKGNLSFAQASHRAFAEEAAGIGFEKRLNEYVRKKSPTLSETKRIIERLIPDANVRQARMIVDFLTKKQQSPEVRIALLDALAQIGQRKVLPWPTNRTASQAHPPSERKDRDSCHRQFGSLATQGAEKDLLSILIDPKAHPPPAKPPPSPSDNFAEAKGKRPFSTWRARGSRTNVILRFSESW